MHEDHAVEPETVVGDDLIARPDFSNDREIQIAAPPADVWPWLAQMGLGRAGWYSWDIIDNFGRRSATELHPEWMIQQVGDPIPGGPISFDTPVVNAPNELVIAVIDRKLLAWTVHFTLAYLLEPAAGGTRLISRARARIDGPGGEPFARYLLGPGDGIMVRKQLKGIAARATSAVTRPA